MYSCAVKRLQPTLSRFSLQLCYNEVASYPVKVALEEPLERVKAGIDAVALEMLVKVRQLLGQDLVVVLLEPHQLREPGDEEPCTPIQV